MTTISKGTQKVDGANRCGREPSGRNGMASLAVTTGALIFFVSVLTGCATVDGVDCYEYQFGRNDQYADPSGHVPVSKPMTGWVGRGPQRIKTLKNLESKKMSLTYTPVGGSEMRVAIPAGGTTAGLAGAFGNGFVSIERDQAFITEPGDGADVEFCFAEEPLPPPPVPDDPEPGPTPFEAVKIPEAREFMAGRWQDVHGGWPWVVVVDDGFFRHPYLPIRPALWPGFMGGTSEGRQVPLPAYGAHGTGVMSLIAADMNNGSGIESVAAPRRSPDGKTVDGCQPIPARADGLLGPGLGMSPTALAAAIEYWIPHTYVRIINVSQSVIDLADGSSLIPAFRKARAKGVLIVIGAGNDKKVRNERGAGGWLAEFDNVLIVGGLNNRGTALWNSPTAGTATGSAIDVYAPAEDLTAIVSPTKVDKVSGTSYATSIVSGVAALMLNVRPSLSPAHIRHLIMKTSDPVPQSGSSGVRRLNAYQAVLAASGPLSLPPP